MKILIVSDSHDNIPNIDKMLNFARRKKIKIMLHCGDVCAPGVLEYIVKNFSGDIYLVFGNVDGDREAMSRLGKKISRLHIVGEEDGPRIKGLDLHIGMTHYPAQAAALARTGKYEIVFYGHDHKPWEKTVSGTRLVNPGTLAGLFQKATFAVWETETGKLELKLLQLM